ncbi:MAG TPA: hypothetical protein VKS44_06985 [Candidatus Acidoferrales bacterium]|nr:hypothetical protein [Candidatus Acidoferrales bacterium]
MKKKDKPNKPRKTETDFALATFMNPILSCQLKVAGSIDRLFEGCLYAIASRPQSRLQTTNAAVAQRSRCAKCDFVDKWFSGGTPSNHISIRAIPDSGSKLFCRRSGLSARTSIYRPVVL